MNAGLRNALSLAVLAVAAFTAGCEKPPMDSIQRGYRGLGMVEIYNPTIQQEKWAANQPLEPQPAAVPGTPPAKTIFKNVRVLGDLPVAEFTRTMLAITSWVAPKDQACLYCHEATDLSLDTKPQKVIARRMLQMTQTVNTDWKSHVAQTGVTCYTCHRGQPIPANVWFLDKGPVTADGPAGSRAEQNAPAMAVGLTSLPFDPFTPFLDETNDVRVISTAALPTDNHKSIKQAEWTYALMMHISQALDVNCTYCHNSRSFAAWDGSTPQRATAWYGIRMVRDLNRAYLEPLKATFPADRLGPTGDVPKVSCTTCHQGAFKPLYGAQMAKDYPALMHAPVQAAAASGTVLAKVLFETGKKNLGDEASAAIAQAVASLKGNAITVDISGFADKTGNADKNLQLAKERAFAVRDALKSAGIGDERIKLKKPEFVIGGAEADARRVDIVAAK